MFSSEVPTDRNGCRPLGATIFKATEPRQASDTAEPVRLRPGHGYEQLRGVVAQHSLAVRNESRRTISGIRAPGASLVGEKLDVRMEQPLHGIL